MQLFNFKLKEIEITSLILSDEFYYILQYQDTNSIYSLFTHYV